MPYYKEMSTFYLCLAQPASQAWMSSNPTQQTSILKTNSQLYNLTSIRQSMGWEGYRYEMRRVYIGDMKKDKIYLWNSDKLGKDNKCFNEWIMQNMNDAEELLDIDS